MSKFAMGRDERVMDVGFYLEHVLTVHAKEWDAQSDGGLSAILFQDGQRTAWGTSEFKTDENRSRILERCERAFSFSVKDFRAVRSTTSFETKPIWQPQDWQQAYSGWLDAVSAYAQETGVHLLATSHLWQKVDLQIGIDAHLTPHVHILRLEAADTPEDGMQSFVIDYLRKHEQIA